LLVSFLCVSCLLQSGWSGKNPEKTLGGPWVSFQWAHHSERTLTLYTNTYISVLCNQFIPQSEHSPLYIFTYVRQRHVEEQRGYNPTYIAATSPLKHSWGLNSPLKPSWRPTSPQSPWVPIFPVWTNFNPHSQL
jgi:hypothetical protein